MITIRYRGLLHTIVDSRTPDGVYHLRCAHDPLPHPQRCDVEYVKHVDCCVEWKGGKCVKRDERAVPQHEWIGHGLCTDVSI